MKSIEIDKVDARSVLMKIAEEFKTTYNREYGEYFLNIPTRFGKGFICGINFPNGIGLFQFEVVFKESRCFDFCGLEVHPFKFLYVIEGDLKHQFCDEQITHEISQGQSVILGANYESGNRIYFPKNKRHSVVILDVDRRKFVDQLTFPLEEMDEIYHRIFADTNAIRTLYHHTQYSLKMAYLVQELKQFNAQGLEKVSFHGAKALELLTYMLMLYKDDNKSEEHQNILRERDLEKIKNIVNKIDQNISDIGTINTLAQMENISEVKLQEGFHILFNCTVHDYIHQKRLETAMQLLQKTNKTISEIVYDIGLNSRSHFSKIFKEKYGDSPTKFRNNIAR